MISDEACTDADARRAYHSAVRMLGQREHSTFELEQKVRRKVPGLNAVGVRRLLEELQCNGWLSDQRFAESLVRGRVSRGYGLFYIERELAAKGVPTDIAALALEQAEVDWLMEAKAVASRRFPDSDADFHSWEKAARYLQRRGFSADVVRSALGSPPDRA